LRLFADVRETSWPAKTSHRRTPTSPVRMSGGQVVAGFKSCQPNQEKCALSCYDVMVVNTK
jgi:hypothetical protein